MVCDEHAAANAKRPGMAPLGELFLPQWYRQLLKQYTTTLLRSVRVFIFLFILLLCSFNDQ
jgi:hypothetical protein